MLSRSRSLAAITVAIAVTVLLLWRLGFLDDRVIGQADHPSFQGELAIQENFTHNALRGNILTHFKTDRFNYPEGEALSFAVANSFHQLLVLPFKLLSNTVGAYNLSVVLFLCLNFLTAFLLARRLLRDRAVACYAALLFSANSYILLKLSQGFMQKYSVFWIPLFFLMLLRLWETRRWRYALWAGGILCLIQLTYPPNALYAFLFCCLVALFYLIRHRGQWLFVASRLAVIALIHLCLSSLIYWSMGLGFAYLSQASVPLELTFAGTLSLLSPFHFYPYASLPAPYPSHLPLGISLSAFLLALWSTRQRRGPARALFDAMVVFTVLAAGAYLTHHGRPVEFGGKVIALPFYYLSHLFPFFGGIYFPIRLFPFINLSLSLCAGLGLLLLIRQRGRIKPRYWIVGASAAFIIELLVLFSPTFPPFTSTFSMPKVCREISPATTGAVLHLPWATTRAMSNRYAMYSALSHVPMVNPYQEDHPHPIQTPPASAPATVKEAFVQKLSTWKVRYVLLHLDLLRPGGSPETGGRQPPFSWLIPRLCQRTQYYKEDRVLACILQP